MGFTYKVGNVTQYGLLLAEAVKLDKSGDIVSLYENADKSEYIMIWWTKDRIYDYNGEKLDNPTYIEIERTSFTNQEDASFAWIQAAFGVSV